MSHHMEPLAAQRARESEDVDRRGAKLIGLRALGLARQVVSALIRRHDTKAALGQRPEIVAPAEPELGEAVQENDQRSVLRPGGRVMEGHSVDGHEPEFDERVRRQWVRSRLGPASRIRDPPPDDAPALLSITF